MELKTELVDEKKNIHLAITPAFEFEPEEHLCFAIKCESEEDKIIKSKKLLELFPKFGNDLKTFTINKEYDVFGMFKHIYGYYVGLKQKGQSFDAILVLTLEEAIDYITKIK